MPDTLQITMPQMGESVSEGTVLTWHKQEGDWVDKDETIVEVSTDKVDAEVPAPASGKLVKILAQEDETVAVGQALAELEPSDEAPPAASDGGTAARPAATATATTTATRTAPTPVAEGDARSTPVARRAAAAHGIDLSQVTGTGTGGRVVKDDVLGYIDQNGGGDGAAAPAPAPAEAEVLPIRGPDAALAKYMEASREIPTATSFRTLSVAALDGRRRQLNDALKAARREMKVSFTHLIGYAIAQAWKAHPAMGHAFRQDDGKPQRVIPPHVNLGLAVDVQRKDGSRTLIVPVIKQADTLDFAGFREVYEDLIEKTRDGTLSPDDMQGATITLTNPGGIGTVASVPRLDAGPGHDRRDRRDHVAAGARRGGAGAACRARRLEDHDDDLDLRSPRDPGRGVGGVPRAGSRSCSRAATDSSKAVFRELRPRGAPPHRPRSRRRRPRRPRCPRRRCSPTCRPRPR